jgi:hypothetical protein
MKNNQNRKEELGKRKEKSGNREFAFPQESGILRISPAKGGIRFEQL